MIQKNEGNNVDIHTQKKVWMVTGNHLILEGVYFGPFYKVLGALGHENMTPFHHAFSPNLSKP